MPDPKSTGSDPNRENGPVSRGPNSRAPASRAPNSMGPGPRMSEAPKPWRTEGVPNNGEQTPAGDQPKSPWRKTLVWLILSYLIFFGIATFEDGMSKAQPIPYTEFTAQVEKSNVSEVFSRGQTIQGTLKNAVTVPATDKAQAQQYTQFVT